MISRAKVLGRLQLVGLPVFVLAFLLAVNSPSAGMTNPSSNSSEPVVPEATSTPGDATAEWKTYTNLEYGYSIKHPSEWLLIPTWETGAGVVAQILSYEVGEDTTVISRAEQLSVAIVIENYLPDITLSRWLEERDEEMMGAVKAVSSVAVDGIEGVRRELQRGEMSAVAIYLPKGNKIYILNAVPADSPLIHTFDRMVETFRWTNTESGKPIPTLAPVIEEEQRVRVAADSFPNLEFPFACGATWRISCGYIDDPVCQHWDDQWNRWALDFVNNAGSSYDQPVLAAHSGKVTRTTWDDYGGGNIIKVDVDGASGGYLTFYAHLKSFSVSEGTWVGQRQEIGRSDHTSPYNIGDHIHLALWYNGVSVKPEPMSGHAGFRSGQVFTHDCGGPPSCPQSGGVILYWNANYDCAGRSDGYVQRTSTGWQNVPGSFNDQASSVRVPSGWSVMLYEHSNKGGGKKCFSSDDSDFANDTFDNGVGLNDKVSSFEVFSSPGCPSGPPPSGNWHAEYFDNPDWSGSPRCTEAFSGPFIDKNWGGGSPCGSVPTDNWSARFTSTMSFSGDNYVFHLSYDDGARLFLDGQNIWDQASNPQDVYVCPPRNLSGNHDLRLDFREYGGGASVHLDWDTDASHCVQDAAEFVGQSQYPTVETGQQFSIWFEVRNTGNTTWRDSDGYGLENLNGVTLGAWFRQEIGADVPPGATKRWDIQMTAPSTPGTYTTDWMLKHWDQTFGPYMFIDVTVVPASDTTAPTGRITWPWSGYATNSCPITIQAEASDDQSGVDFVEFHVWYDGSWHHLGNDSSSSYSISWDCSGVSDQKVWFTIHILDNAGNEAMDPGGYVDVILDRQLPSGTITSPQQGGYLTGNNIIINASAQDAESGVKEVQFFVGYDDGTEWNWHYIATDSNGGDGWSATWDASQINDQLVAFWIYIFDRAGNLGSDSIGDVALDRTPPSSWVDPLPEFQNTTSFEVSWSHDPDLAGIREYWVQHRYGEFGMWQPWYAGSQTSAVFQNADDGVTYYFRVRAIDNAGNEEEYPGGDGDAHTTIDLSGTLTPTSTPTNTPTSTPTPTGTAPTATPTPTSTAMPTPVPPTPAPTNTPSGTRIFLPLILRNH